MPRRLQELLEEVTHSVDADPQRRVCVDACRNEAHALARTLPWVHRTTTARSVWRDILKQRCLEAREVGTPYELACGVDKAVYFFLGSCAYPKGNVALMFAPLRDRAGSCSFAPYDTGGLKAHLVPSDASAPWDDVDKERHLAEHLGGGSELDAFAGEYVAAHFRTAMAYVRAPRRSDPDFRVSHGLRDNRGPDRLGWTIEVQVHVDVPFAPDGTLLEEVWLDDNDLLADLPDDLWALARVRPEDRPLDEAVAGAIENRVRRVASS